jgi:uncharacterized protein YtpQ (UPF0354 family)
MEQKVTDTYRVVTHGLKEGFSSELATEKLIALFKSTKERVRPLLESTEVVVKKGMDHPSATKYKNALERCGCQCRVEPDKVPATAKGTPSPTPEQPLQNVILPRLQRQSPNNTARDPNAPVIHRLTGDLAVSFFTKQGDGTEADITCDLLDGLRITAEQLYSIAKHNLYALVQPVFTAKQMRVAPQLRANAAGSTSFFYQVETGGSMEAACILLPSVWESVKDLVAGPLRIVVPTQTTCMFCGADDELTFAVMCEIAHQTKVEGGDSALSDLIYTVDADGSLSLVAEASSPGDITLSHARLRELQPQLLSAADDNSKGSVKVIAAQLESGDSRAAVVVDAENGIVAAYADELDCVALLKFDPDIARAKGWQTGTRLLTVNGYSEKELGIAPDLVLGPKNLGIYGNFRPLIADLLTDDLQHLQYHKSQISEDEWSRALEMGRRALALKVKPRDGRPSFCATPSKAEPKPTVQRKAAAKEPDPAPTVSFVDLGKALATTLVCFWFVWLGVSHVRAMPVDGLYFIACFGILFFAVVGLLYAHTTVRCFRLLSGDGGQRSA